MSVEWVAGLMVAIAIVALGGAALLFFRDRDWFFQWLRGTAGVLLAGTAFYLVLMSASLFGYQQVVNAVPLASISFVSTGPQAWDATVTEGNGRSRVYEMHGDLWQLDVRLLRYSGIGGIFGSDPSFQLERLSGRYLTVEDEDTKEHSEYSLLPDPVLGFDLWESARENGSLFVSAVRSNVALVPIADGAIYEVVLNDDGLVSLRAANSIAEDARKSAGG